jgi:hypothetical protein
VPTSLSVSRGGVKIRKTVLVDEPPMPTVLYAVASTRDGGVAVRVLDEVPEGVPTEAIAVHDDYDADGWRIHEDGDLEYRRELAPGETRKTAFFVSASEDLAQRFFVTPSIEDVRRTTVRASSP